ncbi:MAG: hypothetical protein LC790_06705 [Actinobacteria bacterium]|nr:hypothetical protein [Actinomycetota bacterium]
MKRIALEDPEFAGTYGAEPLEGDDLLLRRKLTGAKEILERQGGRRLAPAEFEQHFGHLPSDGEG